MPFLSANVDDIGWDCDVYKNNQVIHSRGVSVVNMIEPNIHLRFIALWSDAFRKFTPPTNWFFPSFQVKPKYMACVATASYCAASKLTHPLTEVSLHLSGAFMQNSI